MRGYIILFFILMNVSFFLSAQTFTEECLTDNEYNDRYGSYHPNGKLILFESNRSGNWDIYSMDENGNNIIQLTFDLESDRRPSWHPEGDKILFESNRKGEFELFELELASKKIKKIDISYDSTWIPMFARYSPDGNKIAVSLRKNESHAEIFVFDQNTGRVNQLTDFGKRSFYPMWSKDGKSIVFFSRFETDNQDDNIYIIPSEGGQIRKVIDGPTHNFCPSIAPNGKRLVYSESQVDSRPEIFIADIDGKNRVRITDNDSGDTLPMWSPDGKSILLTAYRNEQYEICRIDINQ